MRNALVTGATRGLGLHTAKALAKEGYRVFLTGRDPVSLADACAGIEAAGGSAHGRVLDVTDTDEVAQVATLLAADGIALDVLINNAGILLPGEEGRSLDGLRRTLDTNLIGAYAVLDAFAPLLADQARVVNVSSRLGQLDRMGRGNEAYRISKAGLNAITRIFASRLKERGIKVNSICPGWVRTDMGGDSARKSLDEGIDTILFAANLPDDGPTGSFLAERKEIPW